MTRLSLDLWHTGTGRGVPLRLDPPDVAVSRKQQAATDPATSEHARRIEKASVGAHLGSVIGIGPPHRSLRWGVGLEVDDVQPPIGRADQVDVAGEELTALPRPRNRVFDLEV